LKVLIIVFEVYLSVLHFEMLTLEMKWNETKIRFKLEL
jgi:hypothetical protein